MVSSFGLPQLQVLHCIIRIRYLLLLPFLFHAVGVISQSFFGDEDLIDGGKQISIPFCRKGHTQVTSSYFSHRTNDIESGILVFGGEGINYFHPEDTFLHDLWALTISKIGDSFSHSYDFQWELLTKPFLNNSSISSHDNLQLSRSKVFSKWPDPRSGFSSAYTVSGNLVVFGGLSHSLTKSSPLLGDIWIYITRSQVWWQLSPKDWDRMGKVATSADSSSPSSPETTPFSGPGRRRDALMTVLPLSGRLLIFGGEAFKADHTSPQVSLTAGKAKLSSSGGGSIRSLLRDEASPIFETMDAEEGRRHNAVFGPDRSSVASCAIDVYLLNASLDVMVDRAIDAATDGTSSAIAGDVSSGEPVSSEGSNPLPIPPAGSVPQHTLTNWLRKKDFPVGLL